jgi:hypothetical protein
LQPPAAGAGSLMPLAYRGKFGAQGRQVEWLAQHGEAVMGDLVGAFAEAGHQHDGQGRPHLAQLARKIEAAHAAGHENVGENDVDVMRVLQKADGVARRSGMFDVVAELVKIGFAHFSDGKIVFDHEDGAALWP